MDKGLDAAATLLMFKHDLDRLGIPDRPGRDWMWICANFAASATGIMLRFCREY